MSKDIVEEIAFSRVSTLDVTNRVAREINMNTVNELRLSCSMKLKEGVSKPLPAPTAPAIPSSSIVTKTPEPEYLY